MGYMKRAELLRKYSEEEKLTGEAVKAILSGEILKCVLILYQHILK